MAETARRHAREVSALRLKLAEVEAQLYGGLPPGGLAQARESVSWAVARSPSAHIP